MEGNDVLVGGDVENTEVVGREDRDGKGFVMPLVIAKMFGKVCWKIGAGVEEA